MATETDPLSTSNPPVNPPPPPPNDDDPYPDNLSRRSSRSSISSVQQAINRTTTWENLDINPEELQDADVETNLPYIEPTEEKGEKTVKNHLHKKYDFALQSLKRMSVSMRSPTIDQVVRAMRLARRMRRRKPPPPPPPSGPPEGFCPKINYYARRFWKKSGLGHLLLLCVIIGYACIGGVLFSWLEKENEQLSKDRSSNSSYLRALELSQNISLIFQQNANDSSKQDDVFQLLRDYQQEANILPKNKTNWDFWGAVFYSGTIFTTIGYGHYTCQTIEGRAATMLYALIGIPLLLVTLQDLGKFLTKWLKVMWNNVCFCWSYKKSADGKPVKRPRPIIVRLCLRIGQCFRSLSTCCPRKKKSEKDIKMAMMGDAEDARSLAESSADSTEMEEFDFPVSIAVAMVVIWFVLCSSIFCTWETKWTYFDAVYFFFVTLTTIGFGDVMPDHPKFMTAAFVFVVFGLSLVAIVINLIQGRVAKLKEDAKDFFEDDLLGWESESSSENEEKTGPEIEAKPKTPEEIIQIRDIHEDELPKLGYTVQTEEGYKAVLGLFQVPVQEKHIKVILRICRGTQTENQEKLE